MRWFWWIGGAGIWATLLGAVILLRLLHNGRRPALRGVRWALTVLACIPFVSLSFDAVYLANLLDPSTVLILRRCAAYILLSVAIWGFVYWLVTTPQGPPPCTSAPSDSSC